MRVLSLTDEYAKVDRGFGVETLPRAEYDALTAPAPEAETESEAEVVPEAETEPPKDKAVTPARKK